MLLLGFWSISQFVADVVLAEVVVYMGGVREFLNLLLSLLLFYQIYHQTSEKKRIIEK